MKTGAQNLLLNQFSKLKGKRVGLITNQTARLDSLHLVDAFYGAEDVELVVLFGPEHGIRGDVEDGASIGDEIDNRTSVPIYSLYGTTNKPTGDMLRNVDVLIFDIQDVGARFYTFITTMGRAMQSAAENGIPFLVLDRPNPLGGQIVDGYVLDSLHVSGVGLYPIPVQHGMTVGEIALMIKGEDLLPGLSDLSLDVIRMTDWNREMLWSETGLDWIPTSPNIPTFETALVYPGTCFFEGTIVSEGRGTEKPFLTIGAPWLDARKASQELTLMALPGVLFSFDEVVPRDIEGVANFPKFKDETIQAVTIQVTDEKRFTPLITGIALLVTAYRLAPDEIKPDFFRERWLGLLSGTDRLQNAVESGASPFEIAASWQEEVAAFKQRRTPYLLYD